MHTQGEWIALQENLGLGHKGKIVITTQECIDNNTKWMATVDTEENAFAILKDHEIRPLGVELAKAVKEPNKLSGLSLTEACKRAKEHTDKINNLANEILGKAGEK